MDEELPVKAESPAPGKRPEPITVDLTNSEEKQCEMIPPVNIPAQPRKDCKRTDPSSPISEQPNAKRRRILTPEDEWAADDQSDNTWDPAVEKYASLDNMTAATPSDEEFEQNLLEINNSQKRVRQSNRHHDIRHVSTKGTPKEKYNETFSTALTAGDSTPRNRRKKTTPSRNKAKVSTSRSPARVVKFSEDTLPPADDVLVKHLRGGPARTLAPRTPKKLTEVILDAPISKTTTRHSKSAVKRVVNPSSSGYIATPARQLATLYNSRLATNPIWTEALRLGELVRYEHTARDLQVFTDNSVAANVGWVKSLLAVAPYLRHPAEPTPDGEVPWPTKRPGPGETLKEKRAKAAAVEVISQRIAAENDLLHKYSRNRECMITLLRNEGKLNHFRYLKRGTKLSPAEYSLLSRIGRDGAALTGSLAVGSTQSTVAVPTPNICEMEPTATTAVKRVVIPSSVAPLTTDIDNSGNPSSAVPTPMTTASTDLGKPDSSYIKRLT
jgi:hypothetical protein